MRARKLLVQNLNEEGAPNCRLRVQKIGSWALQASAGSARKAGNILSHAPPLPLPLTVRVSNQVNPYYLVFFRTEETRHRE